MLVVLFIPGDSLPSEPFLPLPFKADKLVHGVLFFIQAWTLSIAFSNTDRQHLFTHRTLFITGLFAISTEIGQLFVPNRTADVLDVLADMIGVGCFLAMQAFVQSKRKRISFAETPSGR